MVLDFRAGLDLKHCSTYHISVVVDMSLFLLMFHFLPKNEDDNHNIAMLKC